MPTGRCTAVCRDLVFFYFFFGTIGGLYVVMYMHIIALGIMGYMVYVYVYVQYGLVCCCSLPRAACLRCSCGLPLPAL